MTLPKVTIYLPSRNYSRFLDDAIESVLQQHYDDWELLLIDDRSEDDTPVIFRRYASHPKIRVLQADGIGPPGVCNLVLREARGEYIIRLDGDDVFDENILLILANYLDRNADIGLVFPDYYEIDEGENVLSLERRPRLFDGEHLWSEPANGACTMFRPNILRELGGYREDLGMQDGFDVWSRLKNRYRCANVNTPLFYYRKHGSSLTTDSPRFLHARRTIKRDASLEQIGLVKPIHCVIPCRTHFDFTPSLWQAKVSGRTLLERALDTALRLPYIDNVIVAADDVRARDTVSKFDSSRARFFERDSRDTARSTGLSNMLYKAIGTVDSEYKGTVLLLFPGAPLVTEATCEEAIMTLLLDDADSVLAVRQVRERLFRKAGHGLLPLSSGGSMRFSTENVYTPTPTVAAARVKNLKMGSLYGSKMSYFLIPQSESVVVDSPNTLKALNL